jgi:uncharacterized protein (UPF0333 family)
MKQNFNFSIKGNQENHSGSAVLLDSWIDVENAAKEAFESDGNANPVTVRKIGNVLGPSQPGYNDYYDIYETYTDSSSDDYYYFAVGTHAEEK